MKLSKKEKSYIYDRVKWYGYNLGSTKDFIVKLYFFEEEDYSENEDGTIAAYYTSMNTLFNILADRGIEYKEAIDIDGYFFVEFSSKEIYKYIKYDINKGKKRKKLTPLERRLKREYIDRLEDYYRIDDTIDSIMAGRATYIPEENLLSTIDIDYIPSDGKEGVVEVNSIVKRVYDDIDEELKKINEEINTDKEYHIEGNITMGDDAEKLILKSSEENADTIKELRKEIMSIYEGDDKVRVLDEGESVENRIYVDEDGNPERADVKVKMNPEDAMLAYIKGLAEFRKRQTGEDIRVVNEEGEEL
jgi:hypothetical protein